MPLTTSQAQRAQQAGQLLASGGHSLALDIAHQLVQESPLSPDANHVKALCLAANGEKELACEAFECALRLAPAQPIFLTNFAKYLRKIGRHREAVKRWQELVLVQANSTVFLELGTTALNADQPETALTAFEQALRLDPISNKAHRGLGKVWLKLGVLDNAEIALRKAVALSPSAENLGVLAHIERLSGRPKNAFETYQKALIIAPESVEIDDAITGTLIDCFEVEAALRHAEALVVRAPGSALAHSTLAALRQEYVRRTEVIDPGESLMLAADQDGRNVDLQMAAIRFLLLTKQSAAALQRIHTLQKIDDMPLLLIFEANALEQAGMSDEAGALYKRADVVFGLNDVAFLNTYIRHLLKRGDIELAAKKATLATQLEPNCQESWAYQATIWRLLNDAREYWLCQYERLIELMPLQLPPGSTDVDVLLNALESWLEGAHQAHAEPVNQSLRGGSQTPGVLFGRNAQPIVQLEAALRRTVMDWMRQLPVDSSHPFLRRNSQAFEYSGSWSVKLWQSGLHANHFHNQGWISSAFYVRLPSSVTDGKSSAGHIQFGQPPVELNLGLPPRRMIQPKRGYLALFPSYMWHGTVPFMDREPRLSVAFDILPNSRH